MTSCFHCGRAEQSVGDPIAGPVIRDDGGHVTIDIPLCAACRTNPEIVSVVRTWAKGFVSDMLRVREPKEHRRLAPGPGVADRVALNIPGFGPDDGGSDTRGGSEQTRERERNDGSPSRREGGGVEVSEPNVDDVPGSSRKGSFETLVYVDKGNPDEAPVIYNLDGGTGLPRSEGVVRFQEYTALVSFTGFDAGQPNYPSTNQLAGRVKDIIERDPVEGFAVNHVSVFEKGEPKELCQSCGATLPKPTGEYRSCGVCNPPDLEG